jgi:hypothetical protein
VKEKAYRPYRGKFIHVYNKTRPCLQIQYVSLYRWQIEVFYQSILLFNEPARNLVGNCLDRGFIIRHWNSVDFTYNRYRFEYIRYVFCEYFFLGGGGGWLQSHVFYDGLYCYCSCHTLSQGARGVRTGGGGGKKLAKTASHILWMAP